MNTLRARPTAFVYNPLYLTHLTGPGHPESPHRLEAIVSHMHNSPLWPSLESIEPQSAGQDIITLVHPEAYVQYVDEACSGGISILDTGDTVVCDDSYSVALLAAGGVIEAARLIFEKSVRNAFCAVRPPGHHAETDVAMGFCLFNNAAIAARYAQKTHGADKILILDWDVHHGNGTQHIFESDPTVFYISLHQYPFYPGTGDRSETGTGAGVGATRNFPLAAGMGDAEYLAIFENTLPDVILSFAPELVIVSSGFDAHSRDPLASMRVSTEAFTRMTEIIVRVSDETCDGRLLSILEGGYDLTALKECVEAHVGILANREG